MIELQLRDQVCDMGELSLSLFFLTPMPDRGDDQTRNYFALSTFFYIFPFFLRSPFRIIWIQKWRGGIGGSGDTLFFG